MRLEFDGVDLERCPFCLQQDALVLCEDGGGNDLKVFCGSCGAQGPTGKTDAEAAERWNAGHVRPSLLNHEDLFQTPAEARAYAMGLQHGKLLPRG